MSLTYGFYNSVSGDRKYDAKQISSIFDGIVNDGIFMSIGTALRVSASSGMTVNVGIGRAWFNHTWTYNDAELPLTLSGSDAVNSRIDSVILEVNMAESVRANSIKILKGTSGSSPKAPTLTSSDVIYQYRLANILVNAGVTVITQSNITDLIGTANTPYITGILKTVNTDTLIAQWQSEWAEYIRTQEIDSAEWVDTFENELLIWKNAFVSDNTTWSDTQKSNFEIWFQSIQDEMSGDIVAAIQLKIDKLTYRQSTTTTFNANGTITEVSVDVTVNTTFNADGTITEIYSYTNGTVKTVVTSFGASNVVVSVS